MADALTPVPMLSTVEVALVVGRNLPVRPASVAGEVSFLPGVRVRVSDGDETLLMTEGATGPPGSPGRSRSHVSETLVVAQSDDIGMLTALLAVWWPAARTPLDPFRRRDAKWRGAGLRVVIPTPSTA
jgi:hypothetical protein